MARRAVEIGEDALHLIAALRKYADRAFAGFELLDALERCRRASTCARARQSGWFAHPPDNSEGMRNLQRQHHTHEHRRQIHDRKAAHPDFVELLADQREIAP
jgi:hypothetical protein